MTKNTPGKISPLTRRRTQPCPVCQNPMGDMPGTRDAYCHNCGFKDPCCE